MIRHRAPWDARSTISRSAHVLERIGLALTGGSCGLFVAAHVGRADIELIGSTAAVFAMMIYGATGFYLGIDLPHPPTNHQTELPLRQDFGRQDFGRQDFGRQGFGTSADVVELLSATGTFLAAVAAVISVSSIVLDETAHATSALLICLAWAVGATLQIAAGIIARKKANTANDS